MDTYGDLVTLLLTFFVLLYSFSSLDAAKWQAFVSSFSGSPQPVAATSNGKIQSVNPLANTIPRVSRLRHCATLKMKPISSQKT